MLGGLPIAGVIVRSTTNVRAGGRTPLSTILHGVWVLLFVALLAPVVELIPMAALAGLLVFIGVRMVNLDHLRHLYRHGEALVYVVTLTAVVALGLLEGVIVGVAVALAMALRRLTRLTINTEEMAGRWHVVVHGSLIFLGVPRLTRVLHTLPAGADVDLDLYVDFMNNAAFEAIHTWRVDHEQTGGQVDIDEIHEDWYAQSSMHTPPASKTAPHGSARWEMPRSTRDDHEDAASPPRLLAGVQDYHVNTAPQMRPLMSRLAQGQRPEALFLTCSDSRIVPNLITASGPGDLFTLRNIGNLVPRQDESSTDTSVGAAIEYAVTVLEVPSIVICGHAHCGAMKALLDNAAQDTQEPPTSQLAQWLGHGKASLNRLTDTSKLDAADPDAVRLLAQTNVIQQLANLLTYPPVNQRIQTGELELFGMYYDLETARVRILDEHSGDFIAVPED